MALTAICFLGSFFVLTRLRTSPGSNATRGKHDPLPNELSAGELAAVEHVAQVYSKRRDAILNSKHLVTMDEVVVLAGLQVQVRVSPTLACMPR